MQVHFKKVVNREDECAVINAVEKTAQIQSAMELLSGEKASIPVSHNGQSLFCNTGNIFYIESVDKRTFIYTKDGCYETKHRLYELEEILDVYFMRCSKSMIVNLKKIKSVKSELGGRMNATMLNDETIVISRSYVKEMKRRLEL